METTHNSQYPSFFTVDFLKWNLKGIAQVMFQANAWCGFFFLAGIFYGAYSAHMPAVAWGAVVGTVTSTLTACLLNYPPEKGREGLWGFNGVLVGCALPTFLSPTPLMWLTLIFFSAMTTWVMVGLNHLLNPYKVSSFTFPFVLLTWFVFMATRVMGGLSDTTLGTPELPTYITAPLDLHFKQLIIYWLTGISQVFLINSWVTGLLFLIGLFLSNRWAAFWAATGSAIALLLALLYQCNGHDIANGLMGFSAVLTAIALGTTFYQVNWRTAIWAIMGVFATVFIQAALDTLFAPIGIPTLTAPFCIATWLFLWPHLHLDKKRLQQG